MLAKAAKTVKNKQSDDTQTRPFLTRNGSNLGSVKFHESFGLITRLSRECECACRAGLSVGLHFKGEKISQSFAG